MSGSSTGKNQLNNSLKEVTLSIGDLLATVKAQKDATDLAIKAEKAALEQFKKPLDFMLSTPLYEPTGFSGVFIYPILDTLYFDGTYDCYCVECGRTATFQGEQEGNQWTHTPTLATNLPVLSPSVHSVSARCTRDSRHRQEFFFQIRDEVVGQSIQKIGQFPSYADIHLGEVKNYTAVLSKNQRNELSKAIGLSSHGVGIGSFVYLRRIFEALVEEAHQMALTSSEWREEDYKKMAMGEKLSKLKFHLPEFMTKNPVLYSVLSKGIHELSEDECLNAFETVKLCIEMILDEKLEHKRRAEKLLTAQAALNRVASQSIR